MKFAVFTWNQFGTSAALLCSATDVCCEELGVTNYTISDVDELLSTRTRRGIESSTCEQKVLAAEVYGGGAKYSPFWRLPLCPFSWIRMFAQEEK
jgi:hypothetical protein